MVNIGIVSSNTASVKHTSFGELIMESPRRRSGTPKARYVAATLFVLLIVLSVFWWISAQEMPVVSIPQPVMPNPNAFLTFNAAADQMLDSGKIGYAISARHGTGIKDDREYTWAEKQKLVSENSPVLAMLRNGLNQEYVNPPARSFRTLFPYYAKYRGMARLLGLEASVAAHRGDYAGAASASMDAMEMGAQMPHGSVLIGGLVGIACQAIGRRPLWQHVDHLDARQARTAIQRMEKIRSKSVPFSATLQEEKWSTQAGLLEILRQPNTLASLTAGTGAPAPAFVNSPILSQIAFMVYSKRRIMNDYTTYMDREIARAKLPFGSAPPTAIPHDPVVEILAPEFEYAGLKWAETDAKNGLIEVTLALRVFKLEHGSYPDSLSALTPGILPKLPRDPFAKGNAFGYRRVKSNYVLYSVGPDGKDDGGTPIDTGVSRSGNPNQRYLVQPNSKGDIVAGTNN